MENIWLLIASLFFYFWGGYTFLPVILYSIALNYAGGYVLGIPQLSGRERLRKGIFISILVLNLLNLGLYIALFPQLIAGLIVRYTDIKTQLNERSHCIDEFVIGIRIFTIGLAKKAIFANSAAITADAILELPPYQNEPAVAWLGLIFYSLQLYFDFSGYSDMAVRIGRMFGFQFPRNFNYPYISCSVSDLWRRWHISLSVWFRDYVYIPLGGNRKGNVYLHLLCVFFLTGVWHGASWNVVLWGIYWGILVIIEKIILQKIKHPIKIPKIISWMIIMFLWLLSMAIFRTNSVSGCLQYFQAMFGLAPCENIGFSLSYYIHRYELFIIVTGIMAMTPLGKYCYLELKKKVSENAFLILENTTTLLLLGISILYVVTGTYNPFIYFQF